MKKKPTSRLLASTALALSIIASANYAIAQYYQDYESTTILEDIVVTGTRTKRRLRDTPVRTEVVGNDLINKTQARSLADAVEFTTGVRSELNCQNCNFSQIRLNGLEGSFTQILFDSQQTVSSLAAVYGIEQIPASMIQQIEIVKGGASSLYGPGAIGGVVNIIPKEPSKNEVEASYRYEMVDGEGENHFANSVASFVSEDKNTNGFIFGQYDFNDGIDFSGDGFTELSERENQSAGFRINRYVDSLDGKLTFDYNLITEERRGGDNIGLSPLQRQLAEDVDSTRHAGMLSWSQDLSANTDYRLTASYAHLDRDTYYGGGGDPNAFGDSTNGLFNFDSQVNHDFNFGGEHTFSWGFQHNSSNLEDQQLGAANRIVDDTFYYSGLYIQDDWKINDKIELITGVRADKHSEVDDVIFSPRVALKANIADNLNFRSSVSTGFRAPQIFDEDLHVAIVSGEPQVNFNSPDLEEEKSISYQAGIEYTPTIGKGVGLFEANLFRTDISDAFFLADTDTNPSDGISEFTRINRGGASVYGLELNAGYQISKKMSVELGYVEQRAEFDNPESEFGSTRFFRTPNRYGAATFSWQDPKWFDFFLGVKYTGEMKVPFRGSTGEELRTSDSFVTVDLSLQKQLDIAGHKPTLTIGARNIFNEFQSDFDNGADRDSDYIYGPRSPRSFYAGLSYKF